MMSFEVIVVMPMLSMLLLILLQTSILSSIQENELGVVTLENLTTSTSETRATQ